MSNKFLIVSPHEYPHRGFKQCDIILVTGDAYVDHPSYGVTVIGRVLESQGYRVGIIAQPDWRSTEDIKRLGKPRLFFGITAGNVDSMVANYTANKRRRTSDDYAPGSNPGLRPDRATIVFANMVRNSFKDSPIIIGGIEASLRRLAHYDYWSNEVRRSLLLDARADILVYGMGEQQICKIALLIDKGTNINAIDGIPGTVVVRTSLDSLDQYIMIPSFEEVSENKEKFNTAFCSMYDEADPLRGRTIVQPHANRFVIQYPPAAPLSGNDLDAVFALPYTRRWHPMYDRLGGVPGFETVRFSIISHRGCPGECSFCSLCLHQGRIVQSRTKQSILAEIRIISKMKDFRGTITDIGGPTANLYAAHCSRWVSSGACKHKQCMMPQKCESLDLGYRETLELWRDALAIPNVKHIFIGSGVRYDLLTNSESDEYLETLCAHHISGQLKVAPEHIHDKVLELMNKPPLSVYEHFIERFKTINQRLKKRQYLVNYFITSHPGADLNSAVDASQYLSKRRLHPEQIQDFIPLPMTLSSSMYYTERHPCTGEYVYVSKTFRERKMQRALFQYWQDKNRKLVAEALKTTGRTPLKKKLLG